MCPLYHCNTTATTTTTHWTSIISALMPVRRSPHDATPPILSVHCHPWPQPHILYIPIQPRSPCHPWPAPTSPVDDVRHLAKGWSQRLSRLMRFVLGTWSRFQSWRRLNRNRPSQCRVEVRWSGGGWASLTWRRVRWSEAEWRHRDLDRLPVLESALPSRADLTAALHQQWSSTCTCTQCALVQGFRH